MNPFTLVYADVELQIDIALFADTVTSVNQTQRPLDIDGILRYVDPFSFPMYALLKKAGKMSVSDSKFEWLEHDTNPRQDAINFASGYNSSATSIVVDNGARFTIGDIVVNVNTTEHMRVTGISTNTLTVVRGYGTTAAASITDNDNLLIIGNAYAENSGAGNENLVNPTTVYNRTQTFKHAFSISGRAENTRFYTGKQRKNRRAEKLQEHLKDIERAFLLGELKEDTSGTTEISTTRGCVATITTNVYDAGGVLTKAAWDQEFLEPGMQHKSNGGTVGNAVKWLFAGTRLTSVLTSFADAQIMVKPGESKYGFAYTQYLSPFGMINIVPHPLLISPTYDGYGILLDMGGVEYCYMQNRDTQYQPGIQANGTDGIQDQWLSDCGLKLMNEKQHAVITGVTG